MKNYVTLAAVLLLLTATLSAQNAITISPHKATINIGDSLQFTVALTVQPGFDASVLLGTACNEYPMSTSVFPSIINYPYTTPAVVTFRTLKYYKRGTYTVYAYAKINGAIVSDSCVIEVINPTPWRIFNAIHSELRPTFVALDNDGTLYHTFLGLGTDHIYSNICVTNIINPIFTNVSSYAPQFDVGIFNMLIGDNNTKYFFTQRGLYKYDGKDVTIYNKSISALPSDSIKRGVIDAKGRLWIGTPSGLASLENYTITRYDKTNTNSVLGNDRITALVVGADNRIWIGTPTGLVVKDGDTWTRYTPENSGLPAPYIFGLVEDKNGVMWMGAGNKVSKYFEVLPSFNDCPETMVGLVKFDGNTWTKFDSTNSPLTSNYVNGLTIDNKGNLWVGTASNMYGIQKIVSGCGLLKYDGTTWTVFNTSNSLLPDNDVQWVGTDRLGNIWFVCKEMFGAMNEEGIPFLVNDVAEQPEASDGIHLFPNPTSTQFTLSGVEGVASVRVVNSLGEEVRKWSEVQGTQEIDVSNLANGLYFVSIRTVTGAVVKPIIVSR